MNLAHFKEENHSNIEIVIQFDFNLITYHQK